MKRLIDVSILPLTAILAVVMAFIPMIFPPPHHAQVVIPAVPVPTTIAPAWFSVFVQDPSPANGNIRRWVWYGPDDSLAHCLSSLTTISGAAGLGGTPWGYRPYTICYQVASWVIQ